ncbi:hypothetical protein CMV_015256 [Castanea mollissima]|uniref:Uncharacterized protein n=1 Tax=Castanea mollissima TaxID=60419 RepID=A0A8J4RAF6_9ROSI|nr:hypothetical protein CMV_015256 [Castanea mollissima]
MPGLKFVYIWWQSWYGGVGGFFIWLIKTLQQTAPLKFGEDKCLLAVHSAHPVAERFTEDPYPVIRGFATVHS